MEKGIRNLYIYLLCYGGRVYRQYKTKGGMIAVEIEFYNEDHVTTIVLDSKPEPTDG